MIDERLIKDIAGHYRSDPDSTSANTHKAHVTALAAFLEAQASGQWTIADASIDAALNEASTPADLHACLLSAAIVRASATGRGTAASVLFERLCSLRSLVGDPRVGQLIARREQDLHAGAGRFDAAAQSAEVAAGTCAAGSPEWLAFTARTATWACICCDLARAGRALAALEACADHLPAAGIRLPVVRAHHLRACAEHDRILANADQAHADGVAAWFLALVAIEVRRFRAARRWLARARDSDERAVISVRFLELLLASAEGRWADLDRGIAALLPEARDHDLVRLRELQLDAALVHRDLPLANALMAHLDPLGTSVTYLPERARLAVLRGDLAEAAAIILMLGERGTPQMVAYLVSHAREWDAATVARIWMAGGGSTPRVRPAQPDDPQLIGRSPAMQTVRALITTCARLDLPVLITGETGTGKEIVARLLHRQGCPLGAPFHALNCAALTDALAEAELFGHTAGAFTGALHESEGLVGAARGGVLFLDEINSLSLRLQGLLLRLLDQGEYRQIGGTTVRRAECRFIIATNQPLDEVCAAGTFRPDLRFRLERLALAVPPLRDRREDIRDLAAHFCAALTGQADRLSATVIDGFLLQDWPGNVRELRNAVERAVLFPELDTAVPAPARSSPRPPTIRDGGNDRRRISGSHATRERRVQILKLLDRLKEIYPADVVRETNCNRQTAANDLAALALVGLLTRVQRGRHGRVNPYRLADQT